MAPVDDRAKLSSMTGQALLEPKRGNLPCPSGISSSFLRIQLIKDFPCLLNQKRFIHGTLRGFF